MADDVQTKPASMTQSTGDIVSVTQVLSTHQHSSSAPNPLRKATSDNHPGNAACITKGRGSPKSKSPTGGATSKSADTAVGVTFNAPGTANISPTVRPVLLDLPSSIGDHFRPNSLPTARQGIDKTNLGRRPSSEPRDDFDVPATDFVMSAITKNISELASDVDDMSWTTSLSHNSSPAPRGGAENTDTVSDRPRFSSTTPVSTGVSTLTKADHSGEADHSGDISEYTLHQLRPKVTLLSPRTPNSVDRPQISSADPAFTTTEAASADIGDVKLSSVCPEPQDSPLSAKEHRPRDVANQDIMPRVRVKQVIMRYSPNSAVDVERINPKTTSKTGSSATATATNVKETRTDCAITKYSQNVATCVQPINTSKMASNIFTADTYDIKLNVTDKLATSKNHKTLSSDSRSEDGDGTGMWCDSGGNMSRWNKTSKLFLTDDDRRLVKSEGQTPVSTEERCRVSQTSSLDQLRLRFQHQRKTAGRFRAELDHLKKKVIDAQHELDKERNGRRRLEEWTDYLERQLETYTSSRSDVEKQYRKLLDTTKEVDQFTRFVIDRYAELHHQLQLNPDNDDDDVVKRQSSRDLQDCSATREMASTGCQRRHHVMHSSRHVSAPSAHSTAVTIDANMEESQRMSVGKSNSRQEEVTDQSNNLAGSDVARSNDSRNVDQQRLRLMARVSKDRSGGETTASGTEGNVENIEVLPHHQKHATLKDRREINKTDGDVEYRQVEKVQSSGQMIHSVWNNVGEDIATSRSSRKKKRTRNKNVNASTQTTPSDDDVQKLGDKSQNDRRVDGDAGHHDVDSEKLADMIRLLAAPILASEVKTALAESRHPEGEVSSLDVVDERTSPSHDNHRFRHHHHHHHPRHHQPAEYRSRWQQTADVMARRPVVTITSYDKSRARDSAERCPYCTRRRRPRFSRQDAGETPSLTDEDRTTLDQMLAEVCRHCDRDCGPGETVSQLKAKLKRAILAKYSHK